MLTGTARAISLDPEVEVAWTADAPVQSGQSMRVPMPGRKLPADQLRVSKQMMGEVPQDIGLELAKLDPGESVIRARGGYNEMLMLCLRTGVAEVDPNAPAPEAAPEAEATATGEEGAAPAETPLVDRETIRTELGNQQLTALADAFMEELRSEAIIKEQ